jgi:WD40 repeat protein
VNALRPGLPDPLISLLGARWALGAPPIAAVWPAGDEAACFGLADGTVVTAPARWDGAARVQPRASGGMELVPATAPRPPVVRIGVHDGPSLVLAADVEGRLLSGGQDGRLVRLGADGQATTVASDPDGAPIAHLAVARGGALAWAAGAHVRCGTAAREMAGPVTALAVDPTGERLAVAHPAGVTVWSVADDTAAELPYPGAHLALAWRADARLLASGLQNGTAVVWDRTQGGRSVLEGSGARLASLAFSRPGGFLATSGGQRVACWDVGDVAAPRRREGGVGSTQPVVRVACHPRRVLVAAGYANGAVLVCQPGSTDILFAREAGGGAVTVLAWSADGAHLALGVEGGEVGIVAFPDSLFRTAQNEGGAA